MGRSIYIKRSEDGAISGIATAPQRGWGEEAETLPDTDPEVLAYLTPAEKTDSERVEDRIKGDPTWDALVQWLGLNMPGKTEEKVINELKGLGRKRNEG